MFFVLIDNMDAIGNEGFLARETSSGGTKPFLSSSRTLLSRTGVEGLPNDSLPVSRIE